MKKLSFYILMMIAVVLSSCSDSPEMPQAKSVHRTVLVYMAACNSLGTAGFDKLDLDEMQAAVRSGALGGGRLLVFHADVQGQSRLLEITPEGQKVLKEYPQGGELTSVHAERMSSVIDEAKRLAPADSYGLILWSHGLGWLQNGISDDFEPELSTQSWGEERGRTMNITSLAKAISGKGLDFLYFDCCYMASVEVAYELRHAVPYIVASAIELPAEGMPYDKNLAPLFDHGMADLIAAARNTFEYYDAKSGSNRTCAISVLATRGLDELAAASRELMRASRGVVPEGFSAQRFMTESRCWFFDMAHYYEALGTTVGDAALMQRWNKALGECVLYQAATPRLWNRLEIERHCGLSTYILDDETDPTIRNYNTLSWYADVVR